MVTGSLTHESRQLLPYRLFHSKVSCNEAPMCDFLKILSNKLPDWEWYALGSTWLTLATSGSSTESNGSSTDMQHGPVPTAFETAKAQPQAVATLISASAQPPYKAITTLQVNQTATPHAFPPAPLPSYYTQHPCTGEPVPQQRLAYPIFPTAPIGARAAASPTGRWIQYQVDSTRSAFINDITGTRKKETSLTLSTAAVRAGSKSRDRKRCE